ncbi:MAG: winged helix-turn-helix domain-containing protein [Hyphomicrobiales bacterium]|nr:winged helix-turn-helix domain-containing protein [Hyphomicrobiales bacterium]
MSIPSYQKMKHPILEYLADAQGAVKLSVLRKELAKKLDITAEESKECLASGGSRFSNRANWATWEMKDAGLVESPKRGYYKITQSGRNEFRNSGGTPSKSEQVEKEDAHNHKIAPDNEKIASSLIDMAVEGWRFSRLFSRVVNKLDASEASRYMNQLRYFQKKVSGNLEDNGLKIVDVEGQAYDPGIAVSALNIADFGPDDHLVVNQMVEPIIMDSEGVRRTGTVMLKKVEK